MKNNYLNMLGLAQRAGKCVMGEELVISSIQSNQAKLIILANDIGKQTQKKITDKCKSYNVPVITGDDRETLGHAVGKTHRVAIAILDSGFANKIESLLV